MRDRGVGRLLVAAVTGDAWRTPSAAVARYAGAVRPADVALAADYHGIPGYLRAALLSAGLDGPVFEAVLPAYHRALHTHLRAVSDLALVGEALRSAAAPYAVLKGPVLAATVHQRPDLRAYSDLDVLVPPPHFTDAVDALLRAGCRTAGGGFHALKDAQAGELPLRLPSGGALDLHWHTHNAPQLRRAFSVNPAELVARAEVRDVGGVPAPVLQPADNIVYVAMHMVLSGAHRLVWTKDVDQLVSGAQVPWEDVAARARSANAQLVVAYALRHAKAVLGTPIDPAAYRQLGRSSPWSWLAPMTARLSRPELASHNERLVSRLAARSTRQGVPSSLVQLLRKARAAGGHLGAREDQPPPDADQVHALADFTAWADRQSSRAER